MAEPARKLRAVEPPSKPQAADPAGGEFEISSEAEIDPDHYARRPKNLIDPDGPTANVRHETDRQLRKRQRRKARKILWFRVKRALGLVK